MMDTRQFFESVRARYPKILERLHQAEKREGWGGDIRREGLGG